MGYEDSVSSAPGAPQVLIVGLGNPGEEYVGTRHNIGFDVVDDLARDFDLRYTRLDRRAFSGRVKAKVAEGLYPRFAPKEGAELTAEACIRLTPYLLVKPGTYMNNSGVVVAAIARYHRIRPESIFVIYDDLNLPLGRMRIRPEGGSGGHNGIKSLVACLGTEGFPRLRMGIGKPGLDPASMVDPDFVLDRFEEEERPVIDACLEQAVAAVRDYLGGHGLEELMQRINSFRAPADEGD